MRMIQAASCENKISLYILFKYKYKKKKLKLKQNEKNAT